MKALLDQKIFPNYQAKKIQIVISGYPVLFVRRNQEQGCTPNHQNLTAVIKIRRAVTLSQQNPRKNVTKQRQDLLML
jgi:hypothetical protein